MVVESHSIGMSRVLEKGQQLMLSRDCDAILVPHGQPIVLTKQTPVTVYQVQGGSVTILLGGNMALIHSDDVDALGMEPDPTLKKYLEDETLTTNEKIWHQLTLCFDPEIPVNIVDLGLVYDVMWYEEDKDCRIIMTLTSPTCGMGPILVEDVKHKVSMIDAVKTVNIDLVFDPAWDKEMMSDAAKLQLGLL